MVEAGEIIQHSPPHRSTPMVTIEVEVNKSTVTRAAMILAIALGEFLLIRKINSLE